MPRAGEVARTLARRLLLAWPSIPLALVALVLAIRSCVHIPPHAAMTQVAGAPDDPPATRASSVSRRS